jgi:hypothetical protein
VAYDDAVTQFIISSVDDGFVQDMQLACLGEEYDLRKRKREKERRHENKEIKSKR